MLIATVQMCVALTKIWPSSVPEMTHFPLVHCLIGLQWKQTKAKQINSADRQRAEKVTQTRWWIPMECVDFPFPNSGMQNPDLSCISDPGTSSKWASVVRKKMVITHTPRTNVTAV